jgi:pimeloyl-ACP methyl ester carboxylesterase
MPKSKVRPAVNLRRLYVDSRYGQLHVHSAFPSGGGFDEETTLLAVHGDRETGRALRELAAELGRDRSVFVPDLPGTGESDPVGKATGHAEALAALEDLVEQMRFRQVDVLGRGSGAQVAVALAQSHPQQVRRVVLVDAPAGAEAQMPAGVPCTVIDAGLAGAALSRAVREALT